MESRCVDRIEALLNLVQKQEEKRFVSRSSWCRELLVRLRLISSKPNLQGCFMSSTVAPQAVSYYSYSLLYAAAAAVVGRSFSRYLCAILNYSVLSSHDSIVRVCLHRVLIRHGRRRLGRRSTTTPTIAASCACMYLLRMRLVIIVSRSSIVDCRS